MCRSYLHWGCTLCLVVVVSVASAAAPLKVGVFDVDVSPPIGSPMAYDPCDGVAMPLRAKGIVLDTGDAPIVLCAVDWIGIANDGHKQWRESIASAVGTSSERVSVHTLHQHDAPICDLSAEIIMAQFGMAGRLADVTFLRDAVARVAAAARESLDSARPVTDVGVGVADVVRVASNRRILGPDGKVRATRYTTCRDPELRAEPEGTIDRQLKSISLWHEDHPLVVMTYYATHPQSYYRRGIANPDFPGMARFLRQTTLNGLPHIHFNGAGGNIGAGKYNDGAERNRQELAMRLATAMADAWDATVKRPITSDSIEFRSVSVTLPVAPHLNEEGLIGVLEDSDATLLARSHAARDLAWLRRGAAADPVSMSSLRLGDVCLLHLPGEAVVEYQLYAQQASSAATTAVAAYGDYGTGYICLREQYEQGGYEASQRASRVAPDVEDVLKGAIDQLVQ